MRDWNYCKGFINVFGKKYEGKEFGLKYCWTNGDRYFSSEDGKVTNKPWEVNDRYSVENFKWFHQKIKESNTPSGSYGGFTVDIYKNGSSDIIIRFHGSFENGCDEGSKGIIAWFVRFIRQLHSEGWKIGEADLKAWTNWTGYGDFIDQAQVLNYKVRTLIYENKNDETHRIVKEYFITDESSEVHKDRPLYKYEIKQYEKNYHKVESHIRENI